MPEPYTYETDITVRFRDLDAMEQVHNAVVLVYAEEARVRYFQEVLGVTITDTNGAIVRQDVEYSATITLESAVTVRYRTASIGNSTITMQFEVLTDDDVAATGEVVHVVLDEDSDPRPVPGAWRERILSFEDGGVETA